MNINPFNTFTWHKFEYERHTSKADDLREKAIAHDEAATEHLAWLMAEEKNQRRFLEALQEEQDKAQAVISAITEVKTKKSGTTTVDKAARSQQKSSSDKAPAPAAA